MKKFFAIAYAPWLITWILTGIIFITVIFHRAQWKFSLSVVALILAYVVLENLAIIMKYTTFSLSDQNTILLCMWFGLQYAVIAVIVSSLINLSIRLIFYHDPNRVRQVYVAIFNVAYPVIGLAMFSFLYNKIGISIKTPLGTLLVAILIAGYLCFCVLSVTIIVTLETRKLFNPLKSSVGFVFYTTGLSLIAIYLYYVIGLTGLGLLYCVFIPVKKQAELYATLRIQQEELFIDSLTGINNVKLFTDIIWNKLLKKKHFCLFMTDLNNFKSINDTYGHEVGDIVLVHYASTLKKKLSKNCTIFRNGGDEFTIICDNPEETLSHVLAVLEDSTLFYITIDSKLIRYSTSFGYTIYTGDDTSTKESLMTLADKNMYEYKELVHKNM